MRWFLSLEKVNIKSVCNVYYIWFFSFLPRRIPESFVAQFADVRLHSEVCPMVSLKLRPEFEDLSAVRTAVLRVEA